MDKSEFKNFIDNHKIESHWRSSSSKCINLIIPSYLILKFQKILCLDAMNEETFICEMCEDHFIFDIYNFLEYNEFEHEEIKEIFPNPNNNC